MSDVPLSTKMKAAEIAGNITVAFLGDTEKTNFISEEVSYRYAKSVATIYTVVHDAVLKSISL